jgi:hypothetical protein
MHFGRRELEPRFDIIWPEESQMRKQPGPMETQPAHSQIEWIPIAPAPFNTTGRTAAPAISKSQADRARRRSLNKQRAAQMTAGNTTS